VRLLLTLLLLLGCEKQSACPDGYRSDPPRTSRVADALGRNSEGKPLLDAARGRYQVCWGEPSVPVIDAQRRLLLPRGATDAEAAARMGHLLLHVVEGIPLADGCGTRALAEQQEKKAHALEARLRAALGASPLPETALENVLAAYRVRCQAGK
jgi:hypothetical protein